MHLVMHLASLITDPKRLVTFPVTVAEMCFKFVQDLLTLMV